MESMNHRRVLIATRDNRAILPLKKNLEDEGNDMVLVEDGASALEATLKKKPHMVIVDTDLPIISGERLFHILKNNPQTREVPFLFISDRTMEIKGFRRGFDTFITKPFNINEAYSKVKEVFSSVLSPHVTGQENKEIEGRLSHLSLSDILQLLSLNKKEGVLRLINGDLKGAVYLKDGEIYNAVLGRLEGEKALFRMLTWKEGTLEFSPRKIDIAKRIKISTNNLLIEGLRQYDEWKKNRGFFPQRDALLRLKIDISRLPKDLKPIIYEILYMVEFYPRVGDLIDHSTYTDLEVYKTLALLIKRGVIEVDDSAIAKEEKDRKDLEELLSSYQAVKVFQRLSSFSANGEVGYGRILLLSIQPSLIKLFINACKGLSGLTIDPYSLALLDNKDFFGEIGCLKVGDSEFVFFTIPLDERFKPLGKIFSKNTIGSIILWDEDSLKKAPDILGFKRFLTNSMDIPLFHVLVTDTTLTDERKEDLNRSLNPGKKERIYPLSVKNNYSEKAYWILYNLFGSFLKGERGDVY